MKKNKALIKIFNIIYLVMSLAAAFCLFTRKPIKVELDVNLDSALITSLVGNIEVMEGKSLSGIIGDGKLQIRDAYMYIDSDYLKDFLTYNDDNYFITTSTNEKSNAIKQIDEMILNDPLYELGSSLRNPLISSMYDTVEESLTDSIKYVVLNIVEVANSCEEDSAISFINACGVDDSTFEQIGKNLSDMFFDIKPESSYKNFTEKFVGDIRNLVRNDLGQNSELLAAFEFEAGEKSNVINAVTDKLYDYHLLSSKTDPLNSIQKYNAERALCLLIADQLPEGYTSAPFADLALAAKTFVSYKLGTSIYQTIGLVVKFIAIFVYASIAIWAIFAIQLIFRIFAKKKCCIFTDPLLVIGIILWVIIGLVIPNAESILGMLNPETPLVGLISKYLVSYSGETPFTIVAWISIAFVTLSIPYAVFQNKYRKYVKALEA